MITINRKCVLTEDKDGSFHNDGTGLVADPEKLCLLDRLVYQVI